MRQVILQTRKGLKEKSQGRRENHRAAAPQQLEKEKQTILLLIFYII